MTDDEFDPSRRLLLGAGIAIPLAAAAACTQPTIAAAWSAPAAVASAPPSPGFDFGVTLADFEYRPPTQWGEYTVESTGTLPLTAIVAFQGDTPFVPADNDETAWFVLARQINGAARTGTGPDGTFALAIDTANVRANGTPTPNLITFQFNERGSHWYAWTTPISPGTVIVLPLIYTFETAWSPDLWYPGSNPDGSIGVSAFSDLTDAVSDNNRAQSPLVPTKITAWPSFGSSGIPA